MSRQTCVEEERNSDFLGNLTGKNGIDGGGMVEDTSKSAVEIPILGRLTTRADASVHKGDYRKIVNIYHVKKYSINSSACSVANSGEYGNWEIFILLS